MVTGNKIYRVKRTSWNKGLTKETSVSVARAARGISKALIDRTRVITWGDKISAAKKGKPPMSVGSWNKGYTKETSTGIARMASNQERNEKIRQAMLGRKVTWGAKISAVKKEAFKNPEYARKIMASLQIRPNKPELKLMALLNEHFPNQWKYVGDGNLIIAGKNPDFVNINNKQQLIELFGRYWHRGENPEDRIGFFRAFGFSTIVIWDDELKDTQFVVDKVANFLSVETLHEPSNYNWLDEDKVRYSSKEEITSYA